MNGSVLIRRGLKCGVAALAGLIILLAVLAAALNAGYFRGPLVRFLAARAARQIEVAGSLQTHIFSLHPQVIAEGVSIGNPPWTASGLTAEIGKLTLVFDASSISDGFRIESLQIDAATLRLLRDSAGRANWQRTDPDKGADTPLPLMRSVSMTNTHVTLIDALRHLQFDGAVSIQDVTGVAGPRPLRISGVGQLNGRASTFEITSDPLATMKLDAAYHFTFAERSSGSRLEGRGALSRPFTFDVLDTTFDTAGADLKDLYFLTGVSLVNTGRYRLSGKLARRGNHTQFSDLLLTSGQSDMRGTLSIHSSSGRPKLDAHLDSQVLHVADLGLHAAGRDSNTPPLQLSDATLSPSVVRHGEAEVHFHAHRVDVGRVSLHAVAANMTIDHGILVVAPLSADVLAGKLNAHLRLDARTDTPIADIDLKVTDFQVGQLDQKTAGSPRIDGLMGIRVTVTGRGSSLHQVAATADGSVTAVLPHGTIRTSLAELTGIDLRGLGLLLTKSRQETIVRCAIAKFQEHNGILTAQSLIVDTEPVLITGGGQIHLDSETLDLVFRGHPKEVRILRIKAPLSVRGTLLNPSISIHGGNSALVIVDPGSAKDVDCQSL
jgi:uncharacterized protein involved in outer membrane biogenesis